MKETKGEGNGRSNVILLTVIAIVTMIIVVVGATFAYLASSVGSGDTANVNATTNAGSDLLLFNAGEDISIEANLENFYDGAGNLTGSVDAHVSLQTNNTSEVTYNYGVYITVPQNDFEYSSGTCYTKPAGSTIEAEDAAACLENNSTNIWATVDGSSYACYGAANKVADTFYTNEVACLTNKANMWSPAEAAELVIDLYRNNDDLTEETACTSAGVCVDNMRNIVEGATDQNACRTASSSNTWLPNIYEDSVCYSVVKTADLTTVTTNDSTKLSLIDNVAISATDGGEEHYYKGIVTLINHSHNQIINGNKMFNGILHFERIVPGA